MLEKLSSNNSDRKALILILIVAAVQSINNAILPIYVDEAYYWVWSMRPEWSYYDHPGMVAWIIYPFNFLGINEFTVRLSTVLCMSVAVWYLYKTAQKVMNNEAGWVVLLLFIFLPAVQMGYCFITPDSPLVMFWAMGMYYTYLALKEGKTIHFILSGILTGLMMLSKYAGILFPAAVFIYLLFFRRDVFRDYRLWLSLLIAVLCLFPIFYWNYLNDWISIKFQYEHGTSSGLTFAGWDFAGFVLGSLFVIPTPIFGYIFLKYLFGRTYKGDKDIMFFVVLSLTPMLFFFYKGIFKKMELNWIIPAFIAGAVLIGIAVVKFNMNKLFKYGMIFSIVLTVLLKISPYLPVPANLNIADRLLGYQEAVQILEKHIKDNEKIYSDHLTTASMITFYLKDHPSVHINVPSRFSQYSLWDKADNMDKADYAGIYMGRGDMGQELKKKYSHVELVEKLSIREHNSSEKIFYIYRFHP